MVLKKSREIKEHVQKEVKRNVQEVKRNVQEVSRIGKILFKRPILKFFIFLAIQILLTELSGYFPKSLAIRAVINLLSILISVYFVLIVIHLIRTWWRRLMQPENLFVLLVSYALFIIGILLFFTTIYNLAEVARLGYIKYGTCDNNFNIHDPQVSSDFFYFTAMTFFTVGYGDICPMGIDRIISIITAFFGHLISVVIVALIINNYIRNREEKS